MQYFSKNVFYFALHMVLWNVHGEFFVIEKIWIRFKVFYIAAVISLFMSIVCIGCNENINRNDSSVLENSVTQIIFQTIPKTKKFSSHLWILVCINISITILPLTKIQSMMEDILPNTRNVMRSRNSRGEFRVLIIRINCFFE